MYLFSKYKNRLLQRKCLINLNLIETLLETSGTKSYKENTRLKDFCQITNIFSLIYEYQKKNITETPYAH
jgi:hypothetical protein